MAEKPIRIVSNDKIRGFNEKVRNGLEHALNFMFSTEESAKITLGVFDPFLMPIETYISAYKKKSVLVKIFTSKAFEGELYWFFEMKTAVVLGGLLRMLSPAAIAEKVAGNNFDEIDRDAFGEVGNQLSGILDRAFRSLTSKNIHLRMDFDKKVYPDEAIKLDTFLNNDEYVVLLSDLTIGDHSKQKITLLLPRTLYEMLLNISLELEGITPKILLVHSWDPARVKAMQGKLNSRYVNVVEAPKAENLLEQLALPNLVGIAIDLKALSVPLTHSESILFKRMTANRAFMRTPLFLTWENSSEETLNEIRKTGMLGANKGTFLENFPAWAQAFTKDPSR